MTSRLHLKARGLDDVTDDRKGAWTLLYL